MTVETPEGVDFQFVIAGPGKRSAAFLLDVIIKLAVVVLAGFVLAMVSSFDGNLSGVGTGLLLIVMFSMSWLYGACLETFWNGQTIGKRAQKLRVVRTNGTPIGWYEAFGRNLLLVADAQLMLGVVPLCTAGLLSMAASRKMQRLGDLFFDTMVIDESREFISRAPGITDGVDALTRQDCAGRFAVPERTLAVIERLFEGDRLISDGRREEIARPLSLTLRQWLGYEDPAPDPRNPNTFFAQSPLKHTAFLKRVLKTFAENRESPAAPGRPVRETAAAVSKLPAERWTEEARLLKSGPSSGPRDRASVPAAESNVTLDDSVGASQQPTESVTIEAGRPTDQDEGNAS